MTAKRKGRGSPQAPDATTATNLPACVDLDDVNRDWRKNYGNRLLYDPAYVDLAKKFYSAGARHIDFARAIGVTMQTLANWRLRFPEFKAACEIGRDVANIQVENAVFQSATGYSREAVKILTRAVGEGCSEVVEVPFVEHVPPNIQAATFWLKNRMPDRWREKIEVVTEAKAPPLPIDLTKLSDKEKAVLLLLLEKAEPDDVNRPPRG